MIRLLIAPFRAFFRGVKSTTLDIRKQLRAIDAECEKHGVNSWYHTLAGSIGAVLALVSMLLFPVAFFASISGHMSFDPPSAVDPIYAAGYGFILNRWFWRCMLAVSVIFFIVANYTHPEQQVERKIAKDALRKYRSENYWPWK